MNTPNKLSILRICLVPVMMFFYLQNFFNYGKVIALCIFIIAALTDMLDGQIARKHNMVTDLGKLLDPIADKILVLAGLLLITVDGTIPAPYGVIISVIIIGRDLLISAFRQIAASKNFVMAADKWGKIKAIVTYVAVPMGFLLAHFYQMGYFVNLVSKFTGYDFFRIVTYVVLGIATVLTVASAVNYIVKNKKILTNGKND